MILSCPATILPAEVRGILRPRCYPRATKGQLDAAPDEKHSREAEPRLQSSGESPFPVFLATAVLAVGWSAVLWDTRFISAPDGAWDVLKYAFIGAYAFVTGMLIRRFDQSDLRPSAYASAVMRIILVLLIVAVLHQVRSAVPGRRRATRSSRWPS